MSNKLYEDNKKYNPHDLTYINKENIEYLNDKIDATDGASNLDEITRVETESKNRDTVLEGKIADNADAIDDNNNFLNAKIESNKNGYHAADLQILLDVGEVAKVANSAAELAQQALAANTSEESDILDLQTTVGHHTTQIMDLQSRNTELNDYIDTVQDIAEGNTDKIAKLGEDVVLFNGMTVADTTNQFTEEITNFRQFYVEIKGAGDELKWENESSGTFYVNTETIGVYDEVMYYLSIVNATEPKDIRLMKDKLSFSIRNVLTTENMVAQVKIIGMGRIR